MREMQKTLLFLGGAVTTAFLLLMVQKGFSWLDCAGLILGLACARIGTQD